jgi:hypothetical protein
MTTIDAIEIKEEDPKLMEVERLLSMFQAEEVEINTEPVIDMPDFVLTRNDNAVDPLCINNEFKIVPIEQLFPQEITLEDDNKNNIPLIVS